MTDQISYDLNRSVNEIRPFYSFDISCAGSVPESIICFLESDSFESAIRLAISMGGDSDTMACIAGAIAEPFYGLIPRDIYQTPRTYLDMFQLAVVEKFRERYIL